MSLMSSGLAALQWPGQKGVNLWPLVGIVVVFVTAFVISRFVRGDPYYDRTVSRDRRETGGAPVPFDNDDDGGHGDGGGDGS